MEPYPTASTPPEQARPQPPAPVRIATFFMYAGAALTLIGGIITLASGAALRAGIHRAYPHYTPAQVHGLAAAENIYSVVYTLVLIFLWLWLAWASRAGKPWARIIASILFGLNTVLLLLTLATRARAGLMPHLAADAVVTVLTWVAGLAAIVLLWRRETSGYFTGSN